MNMPKDFAGRTPEPTRRAKKSRSTKTSPKRKKDQPRLLFHGPSFAIGTLVGAALITLAAYGPEILERAGGAQRIADQTTTPNVEKTQELEFSFDKILKRAEVQPDPKPYAVPAAETPASYTIQAASFRQQQDADQLRARLLLENLPAHTASGEANGALWYRVTVGPFARKVDANRAMQHLRNQGLQPIMRG